MLSANFKPKTTAAASRGSLTTARLSCTQSLLGRENYNNNYIQEPVNSRVVEFCVVLTSVTNLHDHFGLYSLTGSTSLSMSMFTLTAV